MKLTVIIVVCLVFVFVSRPVDRIINAKVSSKWLQVILRLLIYWVIFMALYAIAALSGLDVWR